MNKHYLLLSAGLLLSGAAHAQGTELFFSEYDEGAHQSGQNYGGVTNSTGSERAIEIYNPTTSTVSLAPYSVRRYSNGSATPTEEERLVKGFRHERYDAPSQHDDPPLHVRAGQRRGVAAGYSQRGQPVQRGPRAHLRPHRHCGRRRSLLQRRRCHGTGALPQRHGRHRHGRYHRYHWCDWFATGRQRQRGHRQLERHQPARRHPARVRVVG